jgi:hypothetical protein
MVVDVRKIEDGVKVGQKISAEEFVRLLGENPRTVEISSSVLKQSKNISLIVKVLETATERGVPDIIITERGKPSTVLELRGRIFDPINLFVREQVGYRPGPEERILVHLLDRSATTPRPAGCRQREVPISELVPSEIELLSKLEKENQVEIIKDGLKVKLTELGATIARGAKKMYPEYWK